MRESQIEMRLWESLGQAHREPQTEMALGEPSVGQKWPGSCTYTPCPRAAWGECGLRVKATADLEDVAAGHCSPSTFITSGLLSTHIGMETPGKVEVPLLFALNRYRVPGPGCAQTSAQLLPGTLDQMRAGAMGRKRKWQMEKQRHGRGRQAGKGSIVTRFSNTHRYLERTHRP